MKSNMNKAFLNDTIIDIKEISWRLLEQWKAFVIGALCIMVLFLGSMYIHNSKVAKDYSIAQQVSQPSTAQEVINGLPEGERMAVSTAYSLMIEGKKLDEYIHTAPIMQMNPTNVKRLRVSWVCNELEDNYTTAMAYITELQSQDSVNALISASGVNIEPKYFSELIYGIYPKTEVDHSVGIDVLLTEAMDEQAVQEELSRLIVNANNKMQNNFGEHQIKNYRSEISDVYDDRVYTRQINVLNNFANINSYINSLKNYFSETQEAAFDKIQNNDFSSQRLEQISAPEKTITKRNVLIGFLLGGVIYIGFYFLYIILTHLLISPEVLQKASIRSLGEWYDTNSNKNILLRDCTIWKRHHRKKLDREAAINKASQTIVSICEYNNINNLLMALTGKYTEMQKSFISGLSNRFTSGQLQAKCIEISKERDVIDENAIIETEGVLLIVFDSKTRFSEINTIYDRCQDYEKPIIGSIYLG